MKDILERAKFGDKFMTRDGSMAIFWGRAPYGDGYWIITEYSSSACYDKYGNAKLIDVNILILYLRGNKLL